MNASDAVFALPRLFDFLTLATARLEIRRSGIFTFSIMPPAGIFAKGNVRLALIFHSTGGNLPIRCCLLPAIGRPAAPVVRGRAASDHRCDKLTCSPAG